MVEQSSATDQVFHALAHEVRRDILRQLAAGERSVGDLAAPYEMSLAAVSKHVTVLERADLVRRHLVGRRHMCRLNPKPLADAFAWLRFYESYWNDRLDALDTLLTSRAAPKPKPTTKTTTKPRKR